MKTTPWREVRDQKLSSGRIARVEAAVAAELREMDLRDLREAAGKTQEEMAEALKTVQPEISRLERRDDYRISTLQKYVTALGGSLELVAVFGNRRVRLRAS
jgi:DNA-binding XRE family transcriptional regulator